MKGSKTKRSKTTGSTKTGRQPGSGGSGGKTPHQARDGQFQRIPAAVIVMALGGGQAEGIGVENLPTSWAVVKKGLVDCLWLVKGRRPYLMHVEQQSAPDADISVRMYLYRGLILDMQAQRRELRHLQVWQYVLYTGHKPWKLNPRLELEEYTFKYRYVDAKDLDPSPFLASDNPDAVIFAALCRGGAQMLRDVLRRVKELLPEQELADAILKLSVWCAARKSGPRLKSELRKMGLTFDVENNDFIRELVEDRVNEKVEKRVREKLEERVREKLEERVREKLEERVREKLEERVREKLEERVREKLEERVREKLEERVREKLEERVREKLEQLEQEAAETAERTRHKMIDTVVTAMQGRFNGDVPGDLRERLGTYTQEDLLGVLARVVTAASAEDALASARGDAPAG